MFFLHAESYSWFRNPQNRLRTNVQTGMIRAAAIAEVAGEKYPLYSSHDKRNRFVTKALPEIIKKRSNALLGDPGVRKVQ